MNGPLKWPNVSVILISITIWFWTIDNESRNILKKKIYTHTQTLLGHVPDTLVYVMTITNCGYMTEPPNHSAGFTTTSIHKRLLLLIDQTIAPSFVYLLLLLYVVHQTGVLLCTHYVQCVLH